MQLPKLSPEVRYEYHLTRRYEHELLGSEEPRVLASALTLEGLKEHLEDFEKFNAIKMTASGLLSIPLACVWVVDQDGATCLARTFANQGDSVVDHFKRAIHIALYDEKESRDEFAELLETHYSDLSVSLSEAMARDKEHFIEWHGNDALPQQFNAQRYCIYDEEKFYGFGWKVEFEEDEGDWRDCMLWLSGREAEEVFLNLNAPESDWPEEYDEFLSL